MADQYIVVEKNEYEDITTYHFDEKRMFEWLNNSDQKDISILDKFPTQEDDPDWDSITEEEIEEDDYFGSFCVQNVFPPRGVYILKNGHHFKPEKVTHDKVVTTTEYVSPHKARARRIAAKRKAAKK